jgi:hypothetical protein
MGRDEFVTIVKQENEGFVRAKEQTQQLSQNLQSPLYLIEHQRNELE